MEYPENTEIIELRDSMKICLRNVFELIPIQPHLNHVVSIIRTNLSNYSRIESCLFFISATITGTRIISEFREFFELLSNIPTDCPSFFVENYCKYLKEFIDQFSDKLWYMDETSKYSDSIYKWLARVPGPATKILGYDDKNLTIRMMISFQILRYL
ncbi:hypothetical protein RF11_10399 [Thelohanellus kitauei]|uniref:Uncharacterized protein n=1 Tax=Thelohanellus kitauei TaxID=669202 RepID=A0A0C2NF45_THEKT|nr:hypothetical protein RF11_10399 [Thelohanellus kitauei]